MKLSSKGRYAVMALADLAKFEPNEPDIDEVVKLLINVAFEPNEQSYNLLIDNLKLNNLLLKQFISDILFSFCICNDYFLLVI